MIIPSFDDLLEVAGAMGMSRTDFWACTPREFFARQKGFAENQREQAQQAWEVARFNSMNLLQPHLKKGSKICPADIAVFPWEAERPLISADGLTPEQRKERAEKIQAKWDAMDAKKYGTDGKNS